MLRNLTSMLLVVAVCISPLQTAQADSERMTAALDAQPEGAKARYEYRKPGETLAFFGVEPGMTVVEDLPGGGWYSKILLPYLGPDGKLVGANYAYDLWPHFEFTTPEFLETMKTWTTDWTAGAQEWRIGDSAEVTAFVHGELPADMHGTADVVLFIRAMHNMAAYEGDGAFLSGAIQDAYDVLKPGGIAGVVQHQAREDMPDDWANGSNGYLKKSYVVSMMEKAGFELVDESNLLENDKDQPTTDEYVWRLPPSLDGSDDNPERKAQMEAIGESNRMALKFRKT